MLHFVEKNFLGKKIFEISDNLLKKQISEQLLHDYNINLDKSNKFFKRFDPNDDINTLKSHKYLCYVNTNQNVYLMYLTKLFDKKICLLIDKINKQFYILNCQFNESLYNNCIFEGEIIK